METCRGRRGIAPLIHNLGTRWSWVDNFTNWPIYVRKELRHPLNRRLGGPQRGSGRFLEKAYFFPNRIRTQNRPARSESLQWQSYMYICILRYRVQILMNFHLFTEVDVFTIRVKTLNKELLNVQSSQRKYLNGVVYSQVNWQDKFLLKPCSQALILFSFFSFFFFLNTVLLWQFSIPFHVPILHCLLSDWLIIRLFQIL